MLEQALAQADTDWAHYLLNEGKNSDELSNISPDIKPSDTKLLVHLWVVGSKQLVDVYRETECDLLRDALRPILELPKISINEIKT